MGCGLLVNAPVFSRELLHDEHRIDAQHSERIVEQILDPLHGTRLVGDNLPQSTAFILIVELLMLRAAVDGTGLIFTFQVVLAVSAFMIVVHVWGALLRIQPVSETLEIGMYSGLALLTVLFYPVQG